MPVTVTLGNESDFRKFIEKCHKWDRFTLLNRWKIAEKKKCLLLVKGLGPRQTQILIIKLELLPKLPSLHNIPTQVMPGFIGHPAPNNQYYVFGSMIMGQDEVGQLHSGNILAVDETPSLEAKQEEILPKTPTPIKRGRGRPAKQLEKELYV